MLALDAFVLGGLIKPCDNKEGSSKSQPALPPSVHYAHALSPAPATTGFLFPLPIFDSEVGRLVTLFRREGS